MIGGSSSFVQIVAEGQTYHSPSSTEMKTADRQALEKFAAVLYGLISHEIWQEVESRQAQAAREVLMTVYGWIYFLVFFIFLVLLVKPLGKTMAKVFQGKRLLYHGVQPLWKMLFIER